MLSGSPAGRRTGKAAWTWQGRPLLAPCALCAFLAGPLNGLKVPSVALPRLQGRLALGRLSDAPCILHQAMAVLR